jgi:hypothetical protein
VYDAAASGTAVPAPSSLPLYSRSAHAVVHWYALGLRKPTCENGRGVELYDAAVSGTAVCGGECMMPRRLAQPCPLSLYFLPAHAVVYWHVLDPLTITLKWVVGLSCMLPRCLAQPCPLPPLSSLPAHAVVYLGRVAGYRGIDFFPGWRF